MSHSVQHRRHAKYGWLPDLPDGRDLLYAAPFESLQTLPLSVDMRPLCPPVYDQGDLGSCTANAVGGNVQFLWRMQKSHDIVPSRLFIYYVERMIEGAIGYDSGAMLRDGIKAVAKYGAPPETDWPYDIAKFTVRPPANVWTEALLEQALRYARVQRSLSQMKGCLASGFPFVFGFSVYDSFESQQVADTGVVPMPQHGERLLGGHAVMAVGYDESQRRFIVRNSWGAAWGMSGYFSMPYAYLTDSGLSSDFWTIRLMET